MLPGRAAEAGAVLALAAIVTLVIGAPVLRAPSDRVFGAAIVGRHHDPFTVMAQFAQPPAAGIHSQPITDVAGAVLARAAGPVAAYNWLVLLSFPLSAAAAYLLARHLTLSPAGAMVAAFAYAFSPFHVAHAAYHAHVAQTQWIPLYLLALWRCVDAPSPAAVGFLGAALFTVTLSNFYGGMIAAVVTPVALLAYWFSARNSRPQPVRRLGLTLGSLLLVTAAGAAYIFYSAPAVVTNGSAFAFPRADLSRYGAKWWSYLVPPAGHPLLGDTARRIWSEAGVREGLLEQQVSLGWGVIALGLVAVYWWLKRDRQAPALARVPALAVIAAFALVCSLSPERTTGTFSFVRPSALLYDAVPMFRSYARFGVVVQLMAALLAGIGVDRLRRGGTTGAHVACAALLALVAAEYAVSPWSMWRDVLPTPGHRWVMQQDGFMRVLDCGRRTQESEHAQWLTQGRVLLVTEGSGDCAEPNLSQKLAATGYNHLLVRRGTEAARSFTDGTAPDGFRRAAHFREADVFRVTAKIPGVYTAAMTGFFPREHDGGRSWRWMGTDADWTIVNTGHAPVVAKLELEMSSFHRTRRIEVLLDGRRIQTIDVEERRRTYQLGPLPVGVGNHTLLFHAVDAPTAPGDVTYNGDRRPLSIALGTWNWSVGVSP